MKSLGEILYRFGRRAGASSAAVIGCEKHLGLRFPSDYKDFLMATNGGEGFIGFNSYVMLWSIEELSSLNDGYETSKYVPQCVLFGSSGGGEAYGFDMRASHTKIVQIPFVGMEWNAAILLSDSFSEFLIKLSEV